MPERFVEGALGSPALAAVAILGGEHLRDVAALQSRFGLRRAGRRPVEQLLVTAAIEVGTEDRDGDQQERRTEDKDDEEQLHVSQAPAGSGRTLRLVFGLEGLPRGGTAGLAPSPSIAACSAARRDMSWA